MKNWSLNAKIISVLGLFFVACVTISTLGINRMGDLNAKMTTIVDSLTPRALLANDLRGIVRLIVVAEKNLILEPTKEGMEVYSKDTEELKKTFAKTFDEAMAISSTEGAKKLKDIEETYNNLIRDNETITRLAMEGKNEEAYALSRGHGREARIAVEKSVAELIDLNKSRMAEESKIADEVFVHSRNIMIGTSTFSILLGSLISFLVLRSLSRSINKIIASLDDGANQVTSAAQQISSSSEELSQSATEQASSLEETSSSVEEMSSMIQKNSDNAKKTAQVATSSQESAAKGKNVVNSMIKAIEDINASNNEISEIVKVISEIGNKTRVINDIVFQTKLLSFNASVEAARAGDHGKGFAVVAEEVGNLAQMSGNAAKDISSMLEGSIQRVERLVATSREKVDVGTRVANECGDVLGEIVNNVSNVTKMADEIARASDEQARGIQQITKAMSQLDQVTQQNAASSEEAASSAEELSGQAESLRGVVRELISTIKGGDDANINVSHGHRSQEDSSSRQRGNVIPIQTASSKKTKHMPTKMSGSSAEEQDHEVPLKRTASGETVPSRNDIRFDEV